MLHLQCGSYKKDHPHGKTSWFMVHLLLKNLTNGHNKHSVALKVMKILRPIIYQNTGETYLILNYYKMITY